MVKLRRRLCGHNSLNKREYIYLRGAKVIKLEARAGHG
jgi:hypothetical protein